VLDVGRPGSLELYTNVSGRSLPAVCFYASMLLALFINIIFLCVLHSRALF
jgi:hypothetical protein